MSARLEPPPVRLSFVCLGNICRSPTAEAVMRTIVEDAGLDHAIHLDSAGTAGWHIGDPPDRRSAAAARRRGIELRHRGRRFAATDFDTFHLVLAMDHENLADLDELAGHATDPTRARERTHLLRSFDPGLTDDDPWAGAVPDPYYGAADGFEVVLDLVDAACRGLLDHVVTTHGLR